MPMTDADRFATAVSIPNHGSFETKPMQVKHVPTAVFPSRMNTSEIRYMHCATNHQSSPTKWQMFHCPRKHGKNDTQWTPYWKKNTIQIGICVNLDWSGHQSGLVRASIWIGQGINLDWSGHQSGLVRASIWIGQGINLDWSGHQFRLACLPRLKIMSLHWHISGICHVLWLIWARSHCLLSHFHEFGTV